MAITYDSVAHTLDSGGDSSATVSHSLGQASGNNRCVIVWVSGVDTNAADLATLSVTYNGTAMTACENPTGTFESGYYLAHTAFYILDADLPSSSGSYNIVATFTGNTEYICIQAISLYGVDQDAPDWFGDADSVTAGTSISQSVTTSVDDSYICSFAFGFYTSTSLTWGTGQTERVDSGSAYGCSTEELATAGSDTQSATFGATEEARLIYSVAVAPSATGDLTADISDDIQVTTDEDSIIPTLLKSVSDIISASTDTEGLIPILLSAIADNVDVVTDLDTYISGLDLEKLLGDDIEITTDAEELIPVLLQLSADTIEIDTAVSGLLPVLLQAVYDNVEVDEYLDKLMSAAADLQKALDDGVTVATEIEPLMKLLAQALSDDVNISTAATPLMKILAKTLADEIEAGDQANPLMPILVQTLADSVNVVTTDSEFLDKLVAALDDNVGITTDSQTTLAGVVDTYLIYEGGAVKLYVDGVEEGAWG